MTAREKKRGIVKFKFVFILFSLIILGFLGFVSLFPFVFFDTPTALLFWKANWPFLPVFLLILGGLGLFYGANRRLFTLLEREDWPALVTFLEDRVLSRGKFRPHLVRLLANTYLILSDSPAVTRLENRAAITRPALLSSCALIFGAARVLGKDFSGAVRFFADRVSAMEEGRGSRRDEWVRWYYGFALLLDRQFSPAADRFIEGALHGEDPVLAGLSACFLGKTLRRSLPARRDEFDSASRAAQKRIRRALPRLEKWQRECGRVRSEIHGAVLGRYLDEAGEWLYGWRGDDEKL
jgi:hypothetical protein